MSKYPTQSNMIPIGLQLRLFNCESHIYNDTWFPNLSDLLFVHDKLKFIGIMNNEIFDAAGKSMRVATGNYESVSLGLIKITLTLH